MVAERAAAREVGRRLEPALADRRSRRPASARRSRRDASRSTASVRRLRLLTPMIVAPGVERRARARRSSCTSTSAASPSCARRPCSARQRRDRRARATISRIASAPAARASSSWYSSTMKSLRSSGTSTAARTAARCVERAVEERRLGQHRNRRRAGRARRPCAMRHRIVVGAQHAARRRAPLALGDHVDRSRSRAARAAKRGAVAAAAPCARALERGARLAPPAHRDASRRVAATIASSRSGGRRSRGCSRAIRHRDQASPARRARAPLSIAAAAWRCRRCTASAAPGDEQRRAGVEQHDVARPARARRRARPRRSPAFVAASPPFSDSGAALARPKSRDARRRSAPTPPRHSDTLV